MPENTVHPEQKPEKLIAKLILAGRQKSGMALDPFLGSGATPVAGKKLGRVKRFNFISPFQNPAGR
jgi:site-specific DNA-methyltransferase (adenine-specific)